MKQNKKYIEKINAFVKKLKENPLIDIQESKVGTLTNEFIFNAVVKDNQVSIYRLLAEMYYQMSSCKIEWQCDLQKESSISRYHPDDKIISGLIQIRPIELFLSHDERLNSDWWQKNLLPEEKKDLKDFRYFDFNDDYIRVGYIIENKKIIEDNLVYLLQESDGFGPFNASFDEYFDLILKYKGFQGWQYNHLFQNTETYKRMTFYLGELFK